MRPVTHDTCPLLLVEAQHDLVGQAGEGLQRRAAGNGKEEQKQVDEHENTKLLGRPARREWMSSIYKEILPVKSVQSPCSTDELSHILQYRNQPRTLQGRGGMESAPEACQTLPLQLRVGHTSLVAVLSRARYAPVPHPLSAAPPYRETKRTLVDLVAHDQHGIDERVQVGGHERHEEQHIQHGHPAAEPEPETVGRDLAAQRRPELRGNWA